MTPTLALLANSTADYGELIALLPAAVTVGALLWLDRQRHLAIAWFGSLAATVLAAALLKAQFAGFSLDIVGHVFRARSVVSGHACVAVAFYGGLAVLLWRGAICRGAAIRCLALVLVGLAGAVCWSVLALHWHDALDVIFGALLGGVAPAILALVTIAPEPPRGGVKALLAAAALLAIMHGTRLYDAPKGNLHIVWNTPAAMVGL